MIHKDTLLSFFFQVGAVMVINESTGLTKRYIHDSVWPIYCTKHEGVRHVRRNKKQTAQEAFSDIRGHQNWWPRPRAGQTLGVAQVPGPERRGGQRDNRTPHQPSVQSA